MNHAGRETMDPTKHLEAMLTIASSHFDHLEVVPPPPPIHLMLLDLNAWIQSGGELPRQWAQDPGRRRELREPENFWKPENTERS